MVRGSVMRITRLDNRGSVLEGERSSLVSRNAAKITLTEVNDARPELNESDDRGDLRLYSPAQAQTVRFQAAIDFTLADPDAIELTTGQAVTLNSAGDVVGWDFKTRVRSVPFALEVWSSLDSASVARTGYRYGYTLFPFLRGGTLNGMTFGNGAVTFGIQSARTIRGSRWGNGPYDINTGETGCALPEGPGFGLGGFGLGPFGGDPVRDDHARPVEVSRNKMWTNLLVEAAPLPTCGAVALYDDIDNGDAADAGDTDMIDGGSALVTTDDVLDGVWA